MKTKADELNSGLLKYGEIRTLRDSKRKVIGEEFTVNGELFFAIKNLRQQDYELPSNAKDKVVDLKVKTFCVNGVQKTHKVNIRGTLYEVIKIDPDENEFYMYWYLTKVGDMDAVFFGKSN